MEIIKHRYRQSLYDLCLQTYGTLDMLVKFANDNNITDIDNIPEQIDYYYDKNLVRYEGNKNIYTTTGAVSESTYASHIFEDEFELVFE